jgi:hypothetical protein
MVALANEAVHSTFFWAYLEFLLVAAGCLDKLSSWTEGCSCHEEFAPSLAWKPRQRAISKQLAELVGHDPDAGYKCKLKGRRCHEFAAGIFADFLEAVAVKGICDMIPIAGGLPENSHERQCLLADWTIAIDTILTEVKLKTQYWSTLPWVLCALAFDDVELSRAKGRRAIQMYDESLIHASVDVHHQLSLRFLDTGYVGAQCHDIALRSQLDDFLGGVRLRDLPELRSWVGGLRLIRSNERPTEACTTQCAYRVLTLNINFHKHSKLNLG